MVKIADKIQEYQRIEQRCGPRKERPPGYGCKLRFKKFYKHRPIYLKKMGRPEHDVT